MPNQKLNYGTNKIVRQKHSLQKKTTGIASYRNGKAKSGSMVSEEFAEVKAKM